LKLTILGSGTCVPTVRRSCACYHLGLKDKSILLDIGFGAMRRMAEAGINYKNIDYIFCSHTHPDHVADLVPLLMALQYTPNFHRKKDLLLIGPPGMTNFMQNLAAVYSDWVINPQGFHLHIVETSDQILQLPHMTLTALTMNHSRLGNGYRIAAGEKILAYSGDTAVCENLVCLADHADCALIECSFPDENPAAGHLTPIQAASVAKESQCDRLILTHFYPMMDQIDVITICKRIFHGTVITAEDFNQFKI
jgi:ribonuclease BN (tRNA processing enzyme)